MVDPNQPELSIANQCRLLNINRSSFYYRPAPIKAEDLELMRLIDEQYLKTPTWGSRSMRNHLRRLGYKINRKRVQRLMRLMGLEAIYPKPRTSRPHPQHKIYPYLLRDLTIDRPNQVWAADITYIPMSRGFHVPGGGHGLAQPQGALLASFQHHGGRLLCRGARRGYRALRRSRNIQYRPGRSVYQRGLYGFASKPQRCRQHGWPGPVPGQYFHRAAVVDSQAPLRLPSLFWQRVRTSRRSPLLVQFL